MVKYTLRLGEYMTEGMRLNKYMAQAGLCSRREADKLIEQGKALEFINLCETRHNNQFAKLGEAIAREINRIRLIAVAGPSSSGKTTFAENEKKIKDHTCRCVGTPSCNDRFRDRRIRKRQYSFPQRHRCKRILPGDRSSLVRCRT